MKRKIGWLFLLVVVILSFTSCSGHSYTKLPQPDRMTVHYEDGTEMELLPGQEGFDRFYDCAASFWPTGEYGYYLAEGDFPDIRGRFADGDYLYLQYDQETPLYRNSEDLKVIGIVFPPNGEEPFVYYLQTTEGYQEVFFPEICEESAEPVYPPLSQLMEEWKKAASS